MTDEMKACISIFTSPTETTDLNLLIFCTWKKQDLVSRFSWVSNDRDWSNITLKLHRLERAAEQRGPIISIVLSYQHWAVSQSLKAFRHHRLLDHTSQQRRIRHKVFNRDGNFCQWDKNKTSLDPSVTCPPNRITSVSGHKGPRRMRREFKSRSTNIEQLSASGIIEH